MVVSCLQPTDLFLDNKNMAISRNFLCPNGCGNKLLRRKDICYLCANASSTKVCRRCKVERNKEDFPKKLASKDGKQPYCSFCSTARTSPYRTKNPKKHAERVLIWMKSNPEKVRAHAAVRRAVKTGKLVKGGCVDCGMERVHAHHDDYSKPLEVLWLCPMHHAKRHKFLLLKAT